MEKCDSWDWSKVESREGESKRVRKTERKRLKRKDGGAERVRTDDPHNAIVVLYQLSYDPIQNHISLWFTIENVAG